MLRSPGRRLTRLFLIMLLLPGCQYGILGKKGAAVVSHLDQTVGTTVGKAVGEIDSAETKALLTIDSTRQQILDFLKFNSEKEAHDLSVGILKGTIGYLDDSVSRTNLGALLKTIIDNTAGPARRQLIQLRDDLLDREATRKLRYLLQGVMRDLVLDPTANLLNVALGPETKKKLQGMLQMLIPAILNDSAITQIGNLRSALLGYNMKRDLAGLVDTVLLTANHRLDTPLGVTIDTILKRSSKDISGIAWAIIIGLGLLLITAGAVAYWLHKRSKLNQDMLGVVTREIEKYNDPATLTNSAFYNTLTDNIEKKMTANNLERDMSRFLKDRNIS